MNSIGYLVLKLNGGKLMTLAHYHGLCNRYRGRAVEIRTRDGRVHRGIIHRVTGNRVYLQPLGRGRNLGGFRYGYGGFGWGFGWGIALGAIAGLALIPFFFW
jgi:hypothetical protein